MHHFEENRVAVEVEKRRRRKALAANSSSEDHLRKILPGCHWMTKVPSGIENIAENFNRLSRVHERYRRQTIDRRTGHDIWRT